MLDALKSRLTLVAAVQCDGIWFRQPRWLGVIWSNYRSVPLSQQISAFSMGLSSSTCPC
jgi:hypothetical protein